MNQPPVEQRRTMEAPTILEVPHPLVDRFGRVHTSLRLSVTDRCNIRCFYCMPELNAVFVPRGHLLSFEELARLATLFVQQCGIRDIRVTGGEPLVRRDLNRLIQMLAAIDGLDDLSLTTNGILLAEHAGRLRDAGLKRVNVSLDTLDEATFLKISRRSGLQQVIDGIDQAIRVGFESIKLNALAIRGITEGEVVSLIMFAAKRGIELRFIEFMPLDADRQWKDDAVLSGDSLRAIIERELGALVEVPRMDPAQPAESFELASGQRVGIIRSVTEPFCDACNRLRVTADGSVRNCLFATDETPLRDAIRSGASDETIVSRVQACVAEKRASHGIDSAGFSPPQRPMYAIGG